MAQCLGKAFLSFTMRSTRFADDGSSSSSSKPSARAWMKQGTDNERSTSFTSTAPYGDASSIIMDTSTSTIPSPCQLGDNNEHETSRGPTNNTTTSVINRYPTLKTAPLDALAHQRRQMDAPTRTLLRRCRASGNSRIPYNS